MQKSLTFVFTYLSLYGMMASKAGDEVGEIRENVKRNLGFYLSLRKMSQKELAERLGVSQSAVTNWIKGKNAPDIEMVAAICDILDVSVSDLFGKSQADGRSDTERRLLERYHKRPQMQQAVNILLGLQDYPED